MGMVCTTYVVNPSIRAMLTERGRFTQNAGEWVSRQSIPTDPIGSTTVTFSGVHAGTEIRVYLPDGTELDGTESCDANHVLTWQVYAAGSANNTVSITLLLRGYRWQKFQFTSTVGAVNLPIFQITDLGYSNPV